MLCRSVIDPLRPAVPFHSFGYKRTIAGAGRRQSLTETPCYRAPCYWIRY
jgi:hypothetical protein